MLVVKDLGVQFTRCGSFGMQTSQFIEQHRIVDVLINEVITMVCSNALLYLLFLFWQKIIFSVLTDTYFFLVKYYRKQRKSHAIFYQINHFFKYCLIYPQHQVVFYLMLLVSDGTQGSTLENNQQLLPLFTVKLSIIVFHV